MTDEQIAAKAQELSNDLLDAAYWVRRDPHDAQNVIGGVEQALVKLRALADQP